MRGILIGNPGRQHSDQLALALQQSGLLDLYAHGSPARRGVSEHLEPMKHRELVRYRIMLAAVSRLAKGAWRDRLSHRVYRQFDLHLARLIDPSRQVAVIAYENSALQTFQRAKATGMVTILDAASVHHRWQSQDGDSDRDIAGITARKDQELALADHVLTCSTLARDSYLEAGVAPERCHVAGFGVDLDDFPPRAGDYSAGDRETGPVRFAFVGQVSRSKGADVLAEACQKLWAKGVAFQLDCAGEVDPDMGEALRPYARMHGKLPYGQLGAFYRAADCLIHPSRFDSFGSVVAEALASGIPAIVSDKAGARDMIRDGQTGWVLPSGDTTALAKRMEFLANQPEMTATMAQACRNEAARWSWKAYRDQTSALVSSILADR